MIVRKPNPCARITMDLSLRSGQSDMEKGHDNKKDGEFEALLQDEVHKANKEDRGED